MLRLCPTHISISVAGYYGKQLVLCLNENADFYKFYLKGKLICWYFWKNVITDAKITLILYFLQYGWWV